MYIIIVIMPQNATLDQNHLTALGQIHLPTDLHSTALGQIHLPTDFHSTALGQTHLPSEGDGVPKRLGRPVAERSLNASIIKATPQAAPAMRSLAFGDLSDERLPRRVT